MTADHRRCPPIRQNRSTKAANVQDFLESGASRARTGDLLGAIDGPGSAERQGAPEDC